MNNRPLIRKIIYIALIGGLILPLTYIALPETRDADGRINSSGGVLSQLRNEHKLSQARLTEVDPASETMKLASLGLRGIAVNVLWSQANEQKKNGDYDGLNSTLQALTKIQPNFIRVWEYQAHNLAYNVSMEFDDYESRYHWVKKGLNFLKGGIRYNKQDHRITDSLGFFTGNKFGKSDEKDSFRRIFGSDFEFHEEMSDRIDPESYELREYGHDSWKMAYQWYNYSRNMVDSGIAEPQRSDMIFYMFRPSQIRNMGLSLQSEHPTGSVIQEVWRDSHEEWLDYGEQELRNSLGVRIKLNGSIAIEDKLNRLRDELDALVPEGTRSELTQDILPNSQLTGDEQEEYLRLSELPADQLSTDEQPRWRYLSGVLKTEIAQLDQRIAAEAAKENLVAATEIVSEIARAQQELRTINRDNQTVNYPYWDSRTRTESENATVIAQQALYEAQQQWKQSIYEDEFEFDYRTKKKKITRKGAITLYNEAFEYWKPILKANPRLNDGQLGDRLIDHVEEYRKMLEFTNREWPKDFAMQDMIDARARGGERDGLPTTAQLSEFADDPDDVDDADDADQSEEMQRDKPEAVDEQQSSDDDKAEKADETNEAEKAGKDETGEEAADNDASMSEEARANEEVDSAEEAKATEEVVPTQDVEPTEEAEPNDDN